MNRLAVGLALARPAARVGRLATQRSGVRAAVPSTTSIHSHATRIAALPRTIAVATRRITVPVARSASATSPVSAPAPASAPAASATAGHNDLIREQFRLQAQTFSSAGFAVRGLQCILDVIRPRGDESVLDVACGAAHLGRALAPLTRHVTGVDMTPEMLEQGRQLAAQDGVRNLALLRGDAHALPFVDEQFDLSVCRLALHQVADPAAMVREMVRVTRDDGRVVAADMVADDDAGVAERTHRLEVLRDPSHNRTLSLARMRQLFDDAGAEVISATRYDNPLDLHDWMERSQTPSEARTEIQRALDDELAGGPATGLRPQRGSDGRAAGFIHPWIIVVAQRKRT